VERAGARRVAAAAGEAAGRRNVVNSNQARAGRRTERISSYTAEVLARASFLRGAAVCSMLKNMPGDLASAEGDKVEGGDKVEELIDQLGGTLIVLADISPSNQDEFLGGIEQALDRWFCDTAFQARSGEPERFLYRMLDNAEELQKQLARIIHGGVGFWEVSGD